MQVEISMPMALHEAYMQAASTRSFTYSASCVCGSRISIRAISDTYSCEQWPAALIVAVLEFLI